MLGFACQGNPRNPSSEAQVPDDEPGSGDGAADDAETQAAAELDVYMFGRQLGAIAPCGCTTEPLGGLQYAFGHIEGTSDAEARLVVLPGSFSFPRTDDPEAPTDEAGWAQAAERAEVLQSRFTALGDALVVGLGPGDVASPAGAAALEQLPLPRVLSNASEKLPDGVASHRTVELGGGRKAQVWMILDPALVPEDAEGLPALADPIAGLAEAIGDRASDATLDVVIVQGPRDMAERVAREVDGVDIAVVGGVLEGAEHARTGTPAAKIDDTWIVEPGDRGQTIAHLTLRFDPAVSGVPAVAKWQNVPARELLEAELGRVEARLKKFKDDPAADPAFIANLARQRDGLEEKLAGKVEVPDDGGAVATFDQVKVTCKLPPDDGAKSALAAYDAWVARENKKRFAGVKTPEPPRGAPTYVGNEACETCHEEALELWKGTRHAGAYETLVDVNKQYDLSCVGCHVTGFRKPGGAEVVETRGLVDVQCEQCHGPGSKHADDPDTSNIVREAPATLCMTCHTAEHSDTFEYEAYLRDVLGEGHGAAAREKLGEGPTGRELRAAGFAKAGGSCKKM